MNVSAAIAETQVRIHCGILSSRHDHAKGARPRKRGGDAPGRGGLASKQAGSPFGQSTYCFKYASLPRGLGSGACLTHSYNTLTKGGQPPCRIPTKGAHPLRNSQAGCCPAARATSSSMLDCKTRPHIHDPKELTRSFFSRYGRPWQRWIKGERVWNALISRQTRVTLPPI